MNPSTLLFIAPPFEGQVGGDKNRTRFLWQTLRAAYPSDILLVVPDPAAAPEAAGRHAGFGNVHTLVHGHGRGLAPRAYYRFDPAARASFRALLKSGRYETIFVADPAAFALAREAEKVTPRPRILIDVYMLYSRIAEQSWQSRRSLSGRFFLIEMLRLHRREKALFQRPYRFLFTSREEIDLVRARYNKRRHPGDYAVVPNAMLTPPPAPAGEARPEKPYILFYGTLNSAANEDGFRFLTESLWPLIAEDVLSRGLEIRVVGKNKTPLYGEWEKRHRDLPIRVIADAPDMAAQIRGSLLCLLPLRVGSGTRTRILEAAAEGRAVVTTPLGAEGLEFGEAEAWIRADAAGLAEGVRRLLADPGAAAALGRRLRAKSEALYGEKVVAASLTALAAAPIRRTLRLALVLNRFHPEVGGSETNLFFQASQLARTFDVHVLTPKRLKNVPKSETLAHFRVRRFADAFNLRRRYPNLKTKTLSPGIFGNVLRRRYDLVQCVPSVHYNAMLAFLAAKLRRRPVIVCSFDVLDYAAILARDGALDPRILDTYSVDRRRLFFIKRLDWIFAISQREIDWFKRHNPRVSYSPVPVLRQEYEVETVDPRPGRGVGPDEFVFLSLGRVARLKGQDVALDAFLRALPDMPDARLVFVGRDDYEPAFGAALREKAAAAGGRVIFVGVAPRPEVLAWLRHSNIHVIPVRFMNSGAVVVESWISGIPVIQSDAIDPNLVVEGKNGFVAPSENIEAWAAAMREAYRRRKDLPAMGEAGRRLVLEGYTYEALIDIYARKYAELVPWMRG